MDSSRCWRALTSVHQERVRPPARKLKHTNQRLGDINDIFQECMMARASEGIPVNTDLIGTNTPLESNGTSSEISDYKEAQLA